MSEPVAWPECEEFYNLMRAYRHARIVDREATIDAYEAVKEWLRAEIARKDAAIAELVGICKNVVERGIGASDIRAMEAAIAKYDK